jgi:hypothetical protein
LQLTGPSWFQVNFSDANSARRGAIRRYCGDLQIDDPALGPPFLDILSRKFGPGEMLHATIGIVGAGPTATAGSQLLFEASTPGAGRVVSPKVSNGERFGCDHR